MEFLGAHSTRADPSEPRLEPGEVGIPCALGQTGQVGLGEPAPGFPAAALFCAGRRGLGRTGPSALGISRDCLAAEGCWKYFPFQAVLQPKGL